jgi:hypothetical protein
MRGPGNAAFHTVRRISGGRLGNRGNENRSAIGKISDVQISTEGTELIAQ